MKLSVFFITLAMAATFSLARVVAPDIHGPFSRENSVHEVEYINVRNSAEIQGSVPVIREFDYKKARNIEETQSSVPDTREFDYKKARNTEEIQGGVPDIRKISLRGCRPNSCL